MSKHGCILTFYSTYDALKTEKVLRKINIEVKLIPVPGTISSDCGIGIGFNCQDEQRIREILKAKALDTAGIYNEQKNN